MSDEDYHLRFQVVDPGMTRDDDRIHEEATAFIRARVAEGWTWEKVGKGLKVADAELKAIILDDFLKVTIAERHFQGGEGIKEVAKALNAPVKVLMDARQAMIAEVEDAAIKAYQLTKAKQAQQPS